ncbi:MAG: hypothetical protein JWQ83_1483, partial [Lacunisphaera sp.]|nr:hypothetical protein [Lacunisphaera sp.]
MPSEPTPVPRVAALDAMRGYAILGVVVAHVAQWTRPGSAWLTQFSANGAFGVQLFFVASAFALFLSNAARRPTERRPVADFFIRRFFRIAPMFYAGVVFFGAMGWYARLWAPHGIGPAHVLLTVLFLHGWQPESINAVVPGGWSIATETSFYLLLPLLFRLVTTRARAGAFLVFTLALGPLMNAGLAPLLTPDYSPGLAYLGWNFRYFWIFGQLPVFACGIVLYFLERDSGAPSRRLGFASLLGAGAVVAIFFHVTPPPIPPPFHVAAAYGLASLLFGLALHHLPSRPLVNPPVVFLGKISYSLYFVHFAVM